jgi:TonB family protein
MIAFHDFAGQWLVHALGWTLLHFCWQGAVIAVVLWCALQLLAGRSAQARYLAACGALGLMVALPLATFAHVGLAEYRLALAARGAVEAPALVVQAGFGDGSGPWIGRIARTLDPWVPWLSMAWLIGATLFLVRLSVGFELTRRMRFIAVADASAELKDTFSMLRQRLGVSRPVRLMHSALVEVPTVIGWLRPVVLLPLSCFTGLSETQMEAVLCHELAHVLRHDYLISVVQSVVEAVLFYHPAVWWVSRQVRRERECCCDDLAVTVGGDALAYARALSMLEARRGSYPQVMLGANGGVLTMRIKRLLGCRESSAAAQGAAAVVLALLVVSAVSIGSTARAQTKAEVQVTSAVVTVDPVVNVDMVTTTQVKPIVRVHVTPAPVESIVAEVRPQVQGAGPSQGVSGGVGQGVGQNAGPARISGGVMAGQIESKTAPVYPEEAKAAGVQGAVVLKALIGKTGDVENLQVISGPHELMASAIDAVRQWKYKPYLLNGEPIEVETTITVNYHLGGADGTPMAREEGPDAAGLVARPIGPGVTPPVLRYAPTPEYTADARAKKLAGRVLLHLWVDEQGNPIHVQVTHGLNNELDQQAVAAVERYRFEPALENGRPVVVALNTEVNFEIF